MTFTKHDKGKLPMDLIPPKVLESLARILQHGAQKYSAWNWVKCPEWSRYYAAAQRHLNAWYGGENLDRDDGLPHLAHAMCCIMFLMEMERLSLGEDDRPTDEFIRDIVKGYKTSFIKADGGEYVHERELGGPDKVNPGSIFNPGGIFGDEDTEENFCQECREKKGLNGQRAAVAPEPPVAYADNHDDGNDGSGTGTHTDAAPPPGATTDANPSPGSSSGEPLAGGDQAPAQATGSDAA